MKSRAKVFIGAIASTIVLIITGVTVNLTSSSFEAYCSPDPAMICMWQMVTGTRPDRTSNDVMHAKASERGNAAALATETPTPSPEVAVESSTVPDEPAEHTSPAPQEQSSATVPVELPAIPEQQLSTASARAAKLFVGTWKGTYTCRRGDKIGTMQLIIEDRGGHLAATEFYSRNGNTGRVHYLIEPISSGIIQMSADRSNHTVGYEYSVILNISDDGSRIEGQYVSHPNCSTIELFATSA